MHRAPVLLALVTFVLVGLAAGCGKGGISTPLPTDSGLPAAAPPSAAAPAARSAEQGPAPSAPASPAASAATGRYVIIPERSTASYAVREKFINRELPSLAIAKTSAIRGELVLGAAGVGPSTVSVDLRTLVSDSDRRDAMLRRRYLESERYPLAEFQLQSAQGDALKFAEGRQARFQLTGMMRLHGVERPLTWEVTGLQQDGHLVWAATTQFKLTDFGITPPDIAGMLKADDLATVTVNLTARPE